MRQGCHLISCTVSSAGASAVDNPSESPNSRNIPLPIQREVRKRCGFGCVICGVPLYEYDHLLGWANVQRHVAEEITLLCDKHHREKTSGLLPNEDVLAANIAPFNLRAGVSKPYDLHFSGTECETIIGNNKFTTLDQGYGTVIIPLMIDEVPLIAFLLTDGHLLLNLNLFDENNEQILRICNNQLWYATNPWDIDLKGKSLIIREASHSILIDITFNVPNQIVINRGRFLLNGVEILVRPQYVLLTNQKMLWKGCEAHGVPGGLILGPNTQDLSGFMHISAINRYLGDRSEALAWAKEVLVSSKNVANR